MIFENGSDINEKLLKTIPQFFGMTIDEIQTFIARMSQKEHAEWLRTFEEKLQKERAQCKEYIETKPDYSKPYDATDKVLIDECIKITPDTIDDKGFVATSEVNKLDRSVRLSREKIKNGKVYISPTKIKLAITAKPSTTSFWSPR